MNKVGTKEALVERLNKVFSGDKTFSGGVLIARGGDVLLHKGYGMADKEKSISITSETKFLIGSVTKQFTGMAIMQLYADGLLDFEDPLSMYLSDFPRGDEIRLYHLLSHTSGIVDYANEATAELLAMTPDQITSENIIRMVREKPLNFNPGTQFQYSNSGYLILGHILEKASDTSYGEYLRTHIFSPLGMLRTGVFEIGRPPEKLAVGYTADSNPVRYAEEDRFNIIATKASFGAGCLFSTTQDLYIWDQAMQTEKLLPKQYMKILLTPFKLPQVTAPYSFGWRINTDASFGTELSHTGGIPGFSAGNFLFTDNDTTVIILTNNDQYGAQREALKNSAMLAVMNPAELAG